MRKGLCCERTHALRNPRVECRCDCHEQEPLRLNEGTPWEHLLTVERAIRWAEIRAREMLV